MERSAVAKDSARPIDLTSPAIEFLFGEPTGAMLGKIFINYRPEDSIGTAGRLQDRIAQAFGQKNLFHGCRQGRP
jgi:hypothetical protein